LSLLLGAGGTSALEVNYVIMAGFLLHEDNEVIATPNPYDMELGVCGTDITGVTVTLPSGGSVSLTPGWPGCWGSDPSPTFPSSPSGGTFLFSFSGPSGGDAVSLVFNTPEPTGLAVVTSPAPGATGVPLEPVFEWEAVSGFGEGIEAFVNQPTEEIPHEVLPIDATSWNPWDPSDPNDDLLPGVAYKVNVDVFNDDTTTALTDAGDDFTYESFFAYSNEVGFRTIPEPSTALLLGIGLAALALRRRLSA
jgi:hypothetical protein